MDSLEKHTFSDEIFVFQEGFREGQMPTVAEYEAPQISSCFSMFGENYQQSWLWWLCRNASLLGSLADDPKDWITHLPVQSLTTPLHGRGMYVGQIKLY